MRWLVLSDVHSNLEALEAVLKAAPAWDRVANLGDAVGYGGSPNEVVERLRKLDGVHVRGNHDRCGCGLEEPWGFNLVAAEAVRWTKKTLAKANREWLRGLVKGPVQEGEAMLAHGSPADEDEYVVSMNGAEGVLREAEARVTFVGHTHVQEAYWQRGEETQAAAVEWASSEGGFKSGRLRLEKWRRYLVNPGSVGQPRDRDRRAGFALWDTEAGEITLYRVPYEIAGAQERILAAGLPAALAVRLDEGR